MSLRRMLCPPPFNMYSGRDTSVFALTEFEPVAYLARV